MTVDNYANADVQDVYEEKPVMDEKPTQSAAKNYLDRQTEVDVLNPDMEQ